MPVTTRAMTKRKCEVQRKSSMSVPGTDGCSGGGRGQEEEEEPYFEPNLHPLLIDVVLSTLFNYVFGNDLKACRLVCKMWHLETLPFASSRLPVRISGEIGYCVEDFVKLIKSNSFLASPKFEKFILRPFNTMEGFGQKFLQLFGQSAKELVLDSDDYSVFKVADIAELLQSALNLKSLTLTWLRITETEDIVKLFPDSENRGKPKLKFLKTLHVIHYLTRSDLKSCPTLFEEIFEAAENLSTLNLTPIGDMGLHILKAIEKLGRESTLENLRLRILSSDHFDLLHRMVLKPNGLKLKQLEILYSVFDWCRLMSLFKDTLVALRIWGTPHSFNIIPRMSKLKFLYLKMGRTNHLVCENFNKTFPALENIHLTFTSSDRLMELMNGDGIYQTPESAIQCCFPMGMEILDRIVQLFRTLRSFRCDVRPDNGVEVIQKIWTHMIQLEKLKITGDLPISTNLDSLITGISIRQVRKTLGRSGLFDSLEKQNIEGRRERILMEINKLGGLVSIRNLISLKCLDLELTVGMSENKSQELFHLTHLTAYFAFYPLNRLRNLCVSNCEFSKPCAEILVKDLSLTSWNFYYSNTGNEIIPSSSTTRECADFQSDTFPIHI